MEEIIQLCEEHNIKLLFIERQLPLCVAYIKDKNLLVVYKYLSLELIQKAIGFIKNHICTERVLEVV